MTAQNEIAALIDNLRETFPSQHFDKQPWLARVRQGEWAAIPEDLKWWDSIGLGYLIDGWRLWEELGRGSSERCQRFVAIALRDGRASGRWEGDAIDLWILLFARHRFGQSGDYPSERELPGLDLLCRTLRARLTDLKSRQPP
jgi:hypothetical protein